MTADKILNGKKVPNLRFKEFSEEWKEEELGKFLESYSERVSSDTDIPIYSSSRVGLKLQSEYYDNREISNEGEYGIVPRNYFTYRHMSDDLIFKFNINTFHDRIAVSKEYPVFKIVNLNSSFLLYKLNFGRDFKRFAISNKKGGTRTRLYYKSLSKWKTYLPTLPEQKKIAAFLSSVDAWIENLQQQKEKLEAYKKGVMQKIFSQEIRFKDHNGKPYPNWCTYKLGDIAKFLKGKGISKNDISKEGINECIRYGELYTDYSEVIENIISKTNVSAEDSVVSSVNDLLIPSSGEDSNDIAKVSCLTKAGILLGGDLNILRLKDGNSGPFFAYYLSSSKKSEISKMAQGNSVVHLYNSQLQTLNITIPSFTEQQKIARLFSKLNALINHRKAEIKKAETWKKGLMQQLFI